MLGKKNSQSPLPDDANTASPLLGRGGVSVSKVVSRGGDFSAAEWSTMLSFFANFCGVAYYFLLVNARLGICLFLKNALPLCRG